MTTLEEFQKAIDENEGYTPCQEAPDSFFTPDETEHSRWSSMYYQNARNLCAICPLVEMCLDYALTNNEIYGVWGGLTPKQRLQMKRARRLPEPGLKAS